MMEQIKIYKRKKEAVKFISLSLVIYLFIFPSHLIYLWELNKNYLTGLPTEMDCLFGLCAISRKFWSHFKIYFSYISFLVISLLFLEISKRISVNISMSVHNTIYSTFPGQNWPLRFLGKINNILPNFLN